MHENTICFEYYIIKGGGDYWSLTTSYLVTQIFKVWVFRLHITNDGTERAVKISQEVSCAATAIANREDAMVVMGSHRTKIS